MMMSNHSGENWPGPKKGFVFLVFILLFITVIGYVIQFLWNAILVDATGVKPISYWQAIGLFLLSRILFGGFRFGGPKKYKSRNSRKAPWKERWQNMTEAEKQDMKERWKRRCRGEE